MLEYKEKLRKKYVVSKKICRFSFATLFAGILVLVLLQMIAPHITEFSTGCGVALIISGSIGIVLSNWLIESERIELYKLEY
ncbi:hypothetical protein Desfe_0533 [Desulfurococcus amylolyticus DSM 16532]|uniref:Uncharacterized protein n=1 Tax=Desulfurococcus amylolyticus DSM 16532 TaxID=768672 RepID=I3XR63_DESAM|nr:hypothetical protein Desfe_0533 [Desulfurococcus amylolyticus DSM 16532]